MCNQHLVSFADYFFLFSRIQRNMRLGGILGHLHTCGRNFCRNNLSISPKLGIFAAEKLQIINNKIYKGINRKLSLLLTLVLFCLSCAFASAHDFEAKNADGVSIYYRRCEDVKV